MKKQIVIIIATIVEANPLIEKLKINQVSEEPFKVFQNDELVIIISGVGKNKASDAYIYAVSELRLDKILNAGAAGSLSPNFSVGDVRTIESVVNCSNYYTKPKIIKPKVNTPAIKGFESATLLTTDLPILDSGARKKLLRYSELVDMEGFFIARTAELFGKEASLLKIVSDTPGNSSEIEIRRNIKLVSHLLADQIIKAIDVL